MDQLLLSNFLLFFLLFHISSPNLSLKLSVPQHLQWEPFPFIFRSHQDMINKYNSSLLGHWGKIPVSVNKVKKSDKKMQYTNPAVAFTLI